MKTKRGLKKKYYSLKQYIFKTVNVYYFKE